MSNTTVVKANGANHIVSAAEAGMERWREKFAPARPLDACCHTCGGGLQRDYVRLRQEDLQGRLIWLAYRAVSCAIHMVAAALHRSGVVDYYRGVSSLR